MQTGSEGITCGCVQFLCHREAVDDNVPEARIVVWPTSSWQ